jgi:hypothetical protein
MAELAKRTKKKNGRVDFNNLISVHAIKYVKLTQTQLEVKTIYRGLFVYDQVTSL